MTHKIFDALDKVGEEHSRDFRLFPFTTYRGRLKHKFGPKLPVWNGIEGDDLPVEAFIDYGRWLARCYCGNVEYVTPTDPIFFCHSCGNSHVSGKSRPVIFPKRYKDIENAMLKREVIEDPASEMDHPLNKSRFSKPVYKPRDWHPRNKP